jgi:hypothetical protein
MGTHNMSPLKRIGIDPGIECVTRWISEWYGDMSDLRISKICIPNTIKSKDELHKIPKYKEACIGRQTAYHIFLKCLLFDWLQAASKRKSPTFEARMYFPDMDYINRINIRCIGSKFNIRKSQILKNGDMDVIASYGDVIIVDILAHRRSIEIGFTKPFNLLMPLVEDLVDVVVWVPFPNNCSSGQGNDIDFSIANFTAYQFTKAH